MIIRYAKKLQLDVVYCRTVNEFVDALTSATFDAAIIDYHLENYVGTEIAFSMRGIPIILTSHKSQWSKEETTLPDNIIRFVHKKYGAEAILEAAAGIAQ